MFSSLLILREEHDRWMTDGIFDPLVAGSLVGLVCPTFHCYFTRANQQFFDDPSSNIPCFTCSSLQTLSLRFHMVTAGTSVGSGLYRSCESTLAEFPLITSTLSRSCS